MKGKEQEGKSGGQGIEAEGKKAIERERSRRKEQEGKKGSECQKEQSRLRHRNRKR